MLFLKMKEDVVYALWSESFDKIYIGMTSNLIERFKSHNELGKKGFTTRHRPWKVIYVEFVGDKLSALKREKQLKSAGGRRLIRGHVF